MFAELGDGNEAEEIRHYLRLQIDVSELTTELEPGNVDFSRPKTWFAHRSRSDHRQMTLGVAVELDHQQLVGSDRVFDLQAIECRVE